MLKELNKVWFAARRQAAAWRRWHAKLPRNRVRRTRVRDALGRVIGYGAATPIPEPELIEGFCRKRELPSGRIEVTACDHGLETAYRLARYPKPTAAEVTPLPISADEVRELHRKHCS